MLVYDNMFGATVEQLLAKHGDFLRKDSMVLKYCEELDIEIQLSNVCDFPEISVLKGKYPVEELYTESIKDGFDLGKITKRFFGEQYEERPMNEYADKVKEKFIIDGIRDKTKEFVDYVRKYLSCLSKEKQTEVRREIYESL